MRHQDPDLEAIRGLRPDVVLANREENREVDVRRLREVGVAAWVTVTESVPEAPTSLRRVFGDCLQWPVPDWLRGASIAPVATASRLTRGRPRSAAAVLVASTRAAALSLMADALPAVTVPS